METNILIQEKIKELDDDFDALILNNNLTMNAIENITINNINEYKQIIDTHIGMRWNVDGTNYLIALRCIVENDIWDKVEKIVVDYSTN